ncbi:hypothetical protein [Rhizobium paknamense]|uniref:Uncharacterized protein n=1 Tax=Rhizobium paknamense TaxID=1206817 RepID=A0ABU0IIS3_9HYPH|nr:hypothetical protein [Rhizobium paknamense]MDQ0458129.1 hypothetical protein [Rhizobium paknamense]
MSDTNVNYGTILAAGDFVTGVRQDGGDGHPVVLTGNQPVEGGQPQALLYRGPLFPTASSGYAPLTPKFTGETVTTSTFYGPNTPLFNPGIGQGNVRAVGSYKYAEAPEPKADHGMMYEGPFDGTGTWTNLDVPEEIAGGAVSSTIPHSTMGDLVVGNFDLADKPGSASAFIYDMRSRNFIKLSLGPLTTAYGIWQNGGDGSHAYTIVGGYKGEEGLNLGFVLDYDCASQAISHVTTYSYDGKPGIVTHFEGISGIADGYSLAATTDAGAAYVIIKRSETGGFGKAHWVPVAYPGSTGVSTGNTVIDNKLMGIMTTSAGVQAYLATIG